MAGVPKRVGSGSCDTGEESEAGWVAPWGSMKEALSSHPESSGSVMELGAEAQHEQICISQRPFCCTRRWAEDWRDGGDQLGGVSVVTWTREVERKGGRCCRLFVGLGQPVREKQVRHGSSPLG